MAKKRTAARTLAAVSSAEIKTDADWVQEAYGDAIKGQVKVLIDNYIANDPSANKQFLAGLKIIRKARDQALVLVNS